MKILIVNANIAFNEAVLRLLASLGESVHVYSACSANDAQQAWRQLAPEIILLNMEKGFSHLSVAVKQELPEAKIIGMLLFNDDLSYYTSNPGLFDEFISKERFKEQVLPLIRSVVMSDENKEVS